MRVDVRALRALGVLLGVLGAILVVAVIAPLALVVVLATSAAGAAGGTTAAVVGVVVVVTVAVRRTTSTRGDRGGVVVGADHPGLWHELGSIAHAVSASPPDEVRLVAGAGVTLDDDGGWWGLQRGTRHLSIGAGLLVVPDDGATLRALVALELGRLSTGSGVLRPVVLRARERVPLMLTQSEPGARPDRADRDDRPDRVDRVDRVFDSVLGWFLRASRDLCAEQEDLADRLAAEAAGTAAVVGALRDGLLLELAWAIYVETYVLGAAAVAARPEDLVSGFGGFWTARSTGLEAVAPPPRPQRAPHDVRRPLPDRLERLGADPVPGSTGRVPAADLLTSRDDVFRTLTARWFDGTDLEPLAWDELAHRAASDAAARHAGHLGRPLSQAAALLGWSGERALAECVVTEPADLDELTDAAVREVAEGLVVSAVEAALVDDDVGRYVVDWEVGALLVDDAGAPLGVPGLVAACHDAVGRLALAEFLGRHALDDRVPPPPKPVRRLAVKAGFLGLAYVARLGSGRVLGVTERLVVVAAVPRAARPWWRPDLGELLASRPYRFLERIDAAGPEALTEQARPWIATWDEIQEVRVRRNGRLTIRCTDGRRQRVALQGEPLGDPVGVIRALAGDRVR